MDDSDSSDDEIFFNKMKKLKDGKLKQDNLKDKKKKEKHNKIVPLYTYEEERMLIDLEEKFAKSQYNHPGHDWRDIYGSSFRFNMMGGPSHRRFFGYEEGFDMSRYDLLMRIAEARYIIKQRNHGWFRAEELEGVLAWGERVRDINVNIEDKYLAESKFFFQFKDNIFFLNKNK